MGNLNLAWDNSAVLANPNATEQIAYKRKKSIGGAYDILAFTPANPMATSVSAAVAAVLDNIIYQFKVEATCTAGGPVPNINGVQEGIEFACINPVLTSDNLSVSVAINVTGLDIIKARITLFKASDNSVVGGPSVVNTIANSINKTFIGLLASTDYYIKYEFYANVNGVEVVSSSAAYLNALCGGNSGAFSTSTTTDPSCPAPASLVVTAN